MHAIFIAVQSADRSPVNDVITCNMAVERSIEFDLRESWANSLTRRENRIFFCTVIYGQPEWAAGLIHDSIYDRITFGRAVSQVVANGQLYTGVEIAENLPRERQLYACLFLSRPHAIINLSVCYQCKLMSFVSF